MDKSYKFSLKTKDWINEFGSTGMFNQIGKSEIHGLIPPKSVNEKYLSLYIREITQVSNPYFKCTLNDVNLFSSGNGISGTAFRTSNNIFLSDLNSYWSESLPIFDFKKVDRYVNQHSVFIGAKWGGYNYFHYLHTCLPKLSYYLQNVKFDRIIHNSTNKKFVKESLNVIGINLNNVFCLDASPSMKCKELTVVSPIGYGVNPNKESCKFVRDLFKSLFVMSNRRIFISRSGTNYRKLTNEEEITNYLITLGFEIINSEYLSFTDQVKLFSQSEIVISSHGAGLSNIVFCDPKTKILELQSPKYLGLCYWLVADSCDLDYYYLLGEGDYDDNPNYCWSDGQADFTMNMKEFKQTLELMEIL